MMIQVKALNVAIVGGGPGCKAIMDMIFAEKLSQLRMKLIGVACTNPKAVGYLYAREKGIYTTQDYRDLYELKDLNMIIELTGREEVANEISRTKPDHIRLIDHVGAHVFWDLFQIEEQRIAERKRADEALRKSEARYRGIFDSATDSFVIFDFDGNIVEANSKACRMHGYSHEELIKLSGKDIVHPGYYHLFEQFKTDTPMTGEFDCESVDVRNDGTTFNVRLRGTVFDYRGKPHLLAVIRDITERKQAEEALRETRNYLENLINYANAPIIVWDPEKRITLFNNAFKRLTGYAADEVINREVGMLFPEGRRDESLRRITSALAGEYWESVEIPILCKDGSIRIALWNSANIYAEDVKTLLATIAQGTDVTERKQAEEALQKAHDELERRVEERTAELTESNEVLQQQGQTILELSTPAIKLWDQIVMMPMVGVIDTRRAQQIGENLLKAIVEVEARVAILDVTGVAMIDTNVAQHIIKTVISAQMMGAEVVITGISPDAAQTLSKLEIDISVLRTRGTLQGGIAAALDLIGKQVKSRD